VGFSRLLHHVGKRRERVVVEDDLSRIGATFFDDRGRFAPDSLVIDD